MMLLSDIYIYFSLTIFGIVFLIVLGYYFNYRKKRQIQNRVYSKLSTSDKQIFNVVRATEKHTTPTSQNILTTFFNLTGIQISTEQLIKHLYRLENLGLVKVTISYLDGHPIQICKSSYKENSLIKLISKHYKLVTSIFLPLSIIASILCYYLLQFVDLIVHGDLYGYGLVFSYDWANQYWNLTGSIRTYLIITLFLLSISILLTIANFRNLKKIIKIITCTLFMLGILFLSYSAFLLSRLDIVVNSDLYNYGLQFSYNWGETYWFYIGFLYTLFGLSIAVLLVCFIFCSYSKSHNRLGKNKLP